MPTEKSSSTKQPANKRQYSSNKALSSKHHPSSQDKPANIGDYVRSGYHTLTATENREVLKATVGLRPRWRFSLVDGVRLFYLRESHYFFILLSFLPLRLAQLLLRASPCAFFVGRGGHSFGGILGFVQSAYCYPPPPQTSEDVC